MRQRQVVMAELNALLTEWLAQQEQHDNDAVVSWDDDDGTYTVRGRPDLVAAFLWRRVSGGTRESRWR